jgi:molybdate transport system substrate-binding protein
MQSEATMRTTQGHAEVRGSRLLSLTLCALLLGHAVSSRAGSASPGPEIRYPPWQQGKNNDAVERGLQFTVPQVDVLADFHGDLSALPKLVLYVGGNYFFAMAPLVHAFEQQHPEFLGRIFWETIPPGLLVKQMRAGGTVTVGNMTWTVKADAYFAGLKKVGELIDEGLLDSPAVPYVTNQLTIMIPKGNPGRIESLNDLGRNEVRLVMPNPEYEGVARQIKSSLQKAGGASLADTVYQAKVKAGTTTLTQVHHRQTPLFLMQGRGDAGITWKSEAIFQEKTGNPISHVDIPDRFNTTAVYAGAVAKGAPHPAAARQWLEFIRSEEALEISEQYGFARYRNTAETTTP